ncbi:retrotransposon protein, putative, ty1-copia subclass [Tanacetum coccineum]
MLANKRRVNQLLIYVLKLKGFTKKAENAPNLMMIKVKVYIPKPNNPKPTAKECPAKDDACHHCKEVGHWKRNCPVYLAELQKKRKQVGSASSSGVVSVSRLVDNGFVQCFADYGISVSKNGVLYFNVVSRSGSGDVRLLVKRDSYATRTKILVTLMKTSICAQPVRDVVDLHNSRKYAKLQRSINWELKQSFSRSWNKDLMGANQKDDTESKDRVCFHLIGGAVDWKSLSKVHHCMAATESEYIDASEAAMEDVFFLD